MTEREWFQICGACSAGFGLVFMCALSLFIGAELQRLHLWPW